MKIIKKTFGLRASFGCIDLTLVVVAMVAFWPQCSYTYMYLCMYLFAIGGVLQEALNRGLKVFNLVTIPFFFPMT